MIVGVVGLISSGKGTVGDILSEKCGFVKESFAKPLKDAAAIIFNWPRHLLEGDTKESREWREQKDEFWSAKLGKTITPRLILQWMGTEAGRKVFGENLWTAALINRVDPSKNYVITDVRFENEIKAIKDAGGMIVRVKRGSDPEWMSEAIKFLIKEREIVKEAKQNGGEPGEIAVPTILPHRSEWDWMLSEMDWTIDNDGTIEDLEEEVSILSGEVKQIHYALTV